MKIGLMALVACAPACLVAATGSATAATGENPFARDQVTLDIKGLDLASTDGQRRLAIRMDDAARSVCGQRMAGVHLAAERKAQDCRAEVMAEIRTRIEARTAAVSTPSHVQLASAR
ncbi:UrcA family protein [Novosphingobium guangzhouense]|nr:UrcA family protein [Novosphingobium guangzhouense]